MRCKNCANLFESMFDGMYYELTYNGDKTEWYLDVYKKMENVVHNSDGDPVHGRYNFG